MYMVSWSPRWCHQLPPPTCMSCPLITTKCPIFPSCVPVPARVHLTRRMQQKWYSGCWGRHFLGAGHFSPLCFLEASSMLSRPKYHGGASWALHITVLRSCQPFFSPFLQLPSWMSRLDEPSEDVGGRQCTVTTRKTLRENHCRVFMTPQTTVNSKPL